MRLDRARADAQSRGDLAVVVAGDEQAQDVQLARTEPWRRTDPAQRRTSAPPAAGAPRQRPVRSRGPGPLSTRYRTADRPGEIGWRQARARHGHGAPGSGRRGIRPLPRRRQASVPRARTGRDGSPRRRSQRACPRCRGHRRSPARASASRRRAVPPVPDPPARWPRRPLCPEPGRGPTDSRPPASPRPPPRPRSRPTPGRRATAPRPPDSPPGAASNVAGAQHRPGSP